MSTWVVVLGILVGGGGLGAIITKLLSRPVDTATVAKLRAEAKQTAQETAASEVGLLREIIQEVRTSEMNKSERITRLEEANDVFRGRLDKLEERERNMLTRAAVHEAWDQISFQALLLQNPDHPPPPPIIVKEVLPPGDDGYPA